MYIPQLANEVLTNIDKIIDGKTLQFKGILIGNGVMVTESHWRRQARNTFFSRHYFYGPEILGLIGKCKYDASDDTNPSCTMGNKLADEVFLLISRQLRGSIHTIVLVFAMLPQPMQMESREDVTGIAPLIKNFIIKLKMSLDVVQIKMESHYFSMISKFNNNFMSLICYGNHAVIR